MQPIVSCDVAITATKTMSVFALSGYTDPLSKLIRAKNYHDYLASVYLGKLMADYIQQQNLEFDYIIPVPLHWTRRWWRGYNQTEVIAREIARVRAVPVVTCVYRTKRTVFQARLDKTARAKNVKEVFALRDAHVIAGKRVLIIDDLMTSGATLKAFSRVVLSANPASIIACVAARVVQ